MPTAPDIMKGEGFIRTHDLLEQLNADVHTAYETLEEDRASQYLRRCVVRAVFSYVDAAIECIKVEVKSAIRTELWVGQLTEKEKETLGPMHVIPPTPGRPFPLDENIKRTFKIAAKVWELDFQLRTHDQDFADFKRAKDSRNKLAHPMTYYDIQVTDRDMHYVSTGGMWVHDEFKRLFDTRVASLLKDFSPEDREAFYKSA